MAWVLREIFEETRRDIRFSSEPVHTCWLITRFVEVPSVLSERAAAALRKLLVSIVRM